MLIKVLQTSAQGGNSSSPSLMMNWRMLGLLVDRVTSSTTGWAVTIFGTIISVSLAFFYLRNFRKLDQDRIIIVLFGLFALSCTIAWHAHFHMSIILIPPLIYLYFKQIINKNIIIFWFILPILVQFFIYFLYVLIEFKYLPTAYYQMAEFSYGLIGLIINLTFLFWAIYFLKKSTPETA